jgi:hypothetical protein
MLNADGHVRELGQNLVNTQGWLGSLQNLDSGVDSGLDRGLDHWLDCELDCGLKAWVQDQCYGQEQLKVAFYRTLYKLAIFQCISVGMLVGHSRCTSRAPTLACSEAAARAKSVLVMHWSKWPRLHNCGSYLLGVEEYVDPYITLHLPLVTIKSLQGAVGSLNCSWPQHWY